MKGYGSGGVSSAAQQAAKRRWKGQAAAVFALFVFSLLVPLAFLLGLHNRFPSGASPRQIPRIQTLIVPSRCRASPPPPVTLCGTRVFAAGPLIRKKLVALERSVIGLWDRDVDCKRSFYIYLYIYIFNFTVLFLGFNATSFIPHLSSSAGYMADDRSQQVRTVICYALF